MREGWPGRTPCLTQMCEVNLADLGPLEAFTPMSAQQGGCMQAAVSLKGSSVKVVTY